MSTEAFKQRKQILRQIKVFKWPLPQTLAARLLHSETIYRSQSCPSIVIQRPGRSRKNRDHSRFPNWPLRCSPAVRARGRPHGGHGCSHGGSLASRVNACTNKESQNGPCPNLLRPCCDILTPFTDHQLVRPLLPNGKEPTKQQTPFKIPNKSLLCNPAAKAQGRSHGGPGCPTEVLGPRRYILRQVTPRFLRPISFGQTATLANHLRSPELSVHFGPTARIEQEHQRPFKLPNGSLLCSPVVRAQGRLN